MDSEHSAAERVPMSGDAALVTTLAGTAMAFAQDADDEAERWLRALRLHGQVGCALQALGVGETPLAPPDPAQPCGPPRGEPAVAATVRDARLRARARDGIVCTPDLLAALLDVYGTCVERALERRGVTCEEIAERLAAGCDEPEVPAAPS